MKNNARSRLLAKAILLTADALLASACAVTSTESTSTQGSTAGEKYPEQTTGTRVPGRY